MLRLIRKISCQIEIFQGLQIGKRARNDRVFGRESYDELCSEEMVRHTGQLLAQIYNEVSF